MRPLDLDLGAEERAVRLDGLVEILDGQRDVMEPANVHGADRTAEDGWGLARLLRET